MARSQPEKFEEALALLEEIVHKLEAGDLTLEDSLSAFEEGMKLTRICSDRLDEAQKKIETLLRDHQGDISKKPLTLGASEDE